MQLAEALVLSLVQLTGPDGQLVEVNPAHVVTVREPRNIEGHFHNDVKCLVHLDDGKFVAVIEPCAVVRALLEGEPD
jgi:hypothetical protein